MDQDAIWYGGIGLGPSHIVLGWDPAAQKGAHQLLPPPAKRGHDIPNFRPMSIDKNGWTDQDATWYGGRPRPR